MSSHYNRTFLAIDYGKRRIGLARSDPMGIIASTLDTIVVNSRKDALSKIKLAIETYRPNALIIGYPVLASGDRSPMCREIDLFLSDLVAVWNGPLYKVDEDYSSSEAVDLMHTQGKRVGKNKGAVDQLAAVVILRRFLDEHPKD